MSVSDRTIAEPRTTLSSVRVTTVERLRALRAPSYDNAISQLLSGNVFEGAELRAIREELGLTQYQIAETARVSQMTVSRIERGDAAVDREVVARLRVLLYSLKRGADPSRRSRP